MEKFSSHVGVPVPLRRSDVDSKSPNCYALTGSRLSCNRQIRFADFERTHEVDISGDPEDHVSRTLRLDGRA